MKVDAKTLLIGLFAYPIRHSMSPTMHNAGFEKLGLPYVQMAFEVENDTLEDAVKGLRAIGMRGASVSMPNKQLVCKFLDELSPAANLAGAVNTIVNEEGKLIGHNTDGLGFVHALKETGVEIAGKKLVLVGAGDAAVAIATQSALDKVQEIAVFNKKDRFFEGAQKQMERIAKETGCIITVNDLDNQALFKQKVDEADILSNATNVGMKPNEDSSVITDMSLFRKGLIVTDCVYNPLETKLLKEAKEHGCLTVNGHGMLIWQGAACFKLWTGHDMPVDYVRKVISS